MAIYTAGHPVHPVSRNSAYEYGKEVTVGDNVVIGAGSVVTRNIPDWCIAAGNPCRVIRKITENDRRKHIHLTDLGREEFNRLGDIQNRQIAQAFEKLSSEDVNAICSALVMTRNKLSEANDVITIRPFKQSSIKYVISRHKTLYYAGRHLSGTFSAYVDKIVYDFVDQFDLETDCLIILECNGVPAGSIAIKKTGKDTAYQYLTGEYISH